MTDPLLTSNLVTRLRRYAETMGGGASHYLNKVAVEAADEIERLRSDWELAKPQLDRLVQVETERARLRAALELIKARYEGNKGQYTWTYMTVCEALSGDSSQVETTALPSSQERHAIYNALQFFEECRNDVGCRRNPDPTMRKLLQQLYDRSAPTGWLCKKCEGYFASAMEQERGLCDRCLPIETSDLRRQLNEALAAEGQKDSWLEDLLQYLHYDPATKSHPDWVARAQAAEGELAALKRSSVETSARRAICKTCTQEFDLSAGHDCPGLAQKASARPAEAQCSWGCHYVGDEFIRYAACTVHGASRVNGKADSGKP